MTVPIAAPILVVEDNPADARLEREMLAATRLGLPIEVAATLAEAREHLRDPVSCVLLDLGLPDAAGIESLAGVLEAAPAAPVVVLTGLADEQAGTEAVAAGAQDYLIKSAVNPSLLEHAIHYAIERRRADQALREAEERFRALVDNSSDLIAVVDADGRLSYVNPAVEQVLGLTAKDRDSRSALELLHPDDLERVRTQFAATRATPGVNVPIEFRTATSDGGWRMIEAVANNRLHDPAVVGIVINARDVTERTNLTRTLRTLSRCNIVLVHATDEAELLADMCRTVVESGGYRLAWVGYAAHDEARTVTPVAAAGETGYLDGLHVTWGDDVHGQGPTGTAIRTRSTQVVDDLLDAPRFAPWRDTAARYGLRSSMVLPLVVGGEVLGALCIYAPDPRAFNADATALLSELASDLAFGIGRLRDNERLDRSMEGTIQAVAAIVEIRDRYTAGHQHRVAELAAAIADRLGLPDDEVKGIRLAGVVHDIGKISVPAEILTRPGGLTDLEFELIKRHPDIGYDIMHPVDLPWPVAETLRQHHERLDGSGYNRGLRGDQITLAARILAVSDVVEAISHFRPYRPALGTEAALKEIRAKRGTHFDADVVDACVALIESGAFSFSL